jgi:uncharacterized protein
MKCPNCPDTSLVMTDRQGVEIDYCPLCRGVWLDRGELDKLLERAVVSTHARTVASTGARVRQPDFVDSDHRGSAPYPAKRRKSWLNDIFD